MIEERYQSTAKKLDLCSYEKFINATSRVQLYAKVGLPETDNLNKALDCIELHLCTYSNNRYTHRIRPEFAILHPRPLSRVVIQTSVVYTINNLQGYFWYMLLYYTLKNCS